VIVAGCLPLISFDRLRREVRFDGAVGFVSGVEMVDVVRRVVAGETVVELIRSKGVPDLDLPRARPNPVVSIVPISFGCLGSCAYCCVVRARGVLRSCSVDKVADLVKRDLLGGAREFWITAQDTGCFGRDVGSSLAELLKVVCQVEGDFKVRVGMMTPNTVRDDLTALVDVFRNERIFKFIHLPIQSGNDEVLSKMQRCYTIQDLRV